MKKLLLISNSTNPGEPYLGWPRPYIKEFLDRYSVKEVLFIPFAGVSLSKEGLDASYDVYEQRVAGVFAELGAKLVSIHRYAEPIKAISNAQAIAVGGGNTFHLVHELHVRGLMEPIRERANNGMPYMGWSAGSNIACPTLMTTNDMPIIQPPSFNAMNLVPFQINPHYLDKNPEGHGGETREDRINEYLVINPNVTVVGLREACLLEVRDGKLLHRGSRQLRVFRANVAPTEIDSDTDVSFLL